MDEELEKLKTEVRALSSQLEAQALVIGSLCSAWGDTPARALQLVSESRLLFNTRTMAGGPDAIETDKHARDIFGMAETRLGTRRQQAASFPTTVNRDLPRS